MTVPSINWHMLMPELIIVMTFVIVMIFDLIRSIQKSVLAWVTIIGSAIALWASAEMLNAGVIGERIQRHDSRRSVFDVFQYHLPRLDYPSNAYLHQLLGSRG